MDIEEAKERLKNFLRSADCRNCDSCSTCDDCYIDTYEVQAIETIVKTFEQLEQQNIELKKRNKEIKNKKR